ncbi:MAG: polyprenyl synthetase family protein [Planctomycetaceae bacterium]|nr:polyprenyl synthetase family protein [Planctomycetaceae bacterium]
MDEQLSQWRTTVEDCLRVRLESSPDCPDRLREAMAYSLMAGGKRLRPLLVLMACEACGGEIEAAMPAACAIEMVHTYSLIHDDLPAMDDDDERRGKPTNHIQFDEATAILAGDALLTLAFEILATELSSAEVAAACCADLAGAAGMCGMVGGQMADLLAESGEGRDSDRKISPHPSPPSPLNRQLSTLENIHRRKTGRLLCSALTMGGRIAGANPQTLRSLTTYGEAIGLAFQIADDLLDVCGDSETMGKRVRKDTNAGKLTYPALLGEAESRLRAEQLVCDACQAVAIFGSRGQRLEAMAHYIIARDR